MPRPTTTRILLWLGSLGLPVALLGLETVLYPGVLENNLSLTPLALIAVFLCLHLGLRLIRPAVSNQFVYLGIVWAAVATFFISLAGIQLNAFTDPTFMLRTFFIHPAPLQLLTWFFAGVAVIYIRKDWFRTLHPWLTAALPLLLLAVFMSLYFNYAHEIFAKLKTEDGPFEYGTFLTFLVGAGVAAQTAWKLGHSSYNPNLGLGSWVDTTAHWSLVIGFVAVSIAFFFVAGEEISWGQRILGLETPPEYAAVNTQNELTIHNHHDFINLVYYGYLYISLAAASAWILVKAVAIAGWKAGSRWLEWLAPAWWIVPWFLPMICYVPVRETFGYIRFGQWEEMSELFFSGGFLVHLIVTNLRVRSHTTATK